MLDRLEDELLRRIKRDIVRQFPGEMTGDFVSDVLKTPAKADEDDLTCR